METFLEQLYYGKINPSERPVPDSPDYFSLNREIALETEQWRKRLPETEFKQLERLLDLFDQMISVQAASSYMHGFRDGAKLIVEVSMK
ncbi:hypothetical protein QWJ34_19020 [Saccharibacillus sp. CPCC 101409]|uniref:DUF6809 family protein n=1 Tax=Saccharibacillus sp. CPCC 101409 TaxID=3058041 RepID=UPI0026725A68|nr:DUF6809 family protein [Saccharibacillus sp. CPCC 101409]MDO3411862.1 hypothetical protein [Saccharibacillus sp. CPCC 101409]